MACAYALFRRTLFNRPLEPGVDVGGDAILAPFRHTAQYCTVPYCEVSREKDLRHHPGRLFHLGRILPLFQQRIADAFYQGEYVIMILGI